MRLGHIQSCFQMAIMEIVPDHQGPYFHKRITPSDLSICQAPIPYPSPCEVSWSEIPGSIFISDPPAQWKQASPDSSLHMHLIILASATMLLGHRQIIGLGARDSWNPNWVATSRVGASKSFSQSGETKKQRFAIAKKWQCFPAKISEGIFNDFFIVWVDKNFKLIEIDELLE